MVPPPAQQSAKTLQKLLRCEMSSDNELSGSTTWAWNPPWSQFDRSSSDPKRPRFVTEGRRGGGSHSPVPGQSPGESSFEFTNVWVNFKARLTLSALQPAPFFNRFLWCGSTHCPTWGGGQCHWSAPGRWGVPGSDDWFQVASAWVPRMRICEQSTGHH